MKTAPNSVPAARLASYERLVATNPDVVRKGKANPYTSLNGHMFTLLSPTGTLAIRLPKNEREHFLKKFKTTLFESHGHVMPEFVTVPDRLLSNTKSVEPYFVMSYAYVSSLKPKSSASAGEKSKESSRKKSS